MNTDQIKQRAIEALDELKAKDVITLDVREMTDITDYMVICTGTSSRHVRSLANNVALELKRSGNPAMGIEGVDQSSEWALIDLGAVVVHVMLPDTRDFYDLERLWSVAPSEPGSDSDSDSDSE